MAVRSNSKEALDAIRQDLAEDCEDYFADAAYDIKATPFDAYQAMKEEMAADYVKDGAATALERWVRGLSFGDFLQAQDIVARWLQQTPEEVGKYSRTESEDMYVSLIQRELPAMADKAMPKEGWAVEFNPYKDSHEKNGISYAVKLHHDGLPAANVTGLNPREARFLYDACRKSVEETGDIPPAFKGESTLYDDAINRVEAACREAATVAFRFVEANKRDINMWHREAIDDDTYYASVAYRDEIMAKTLPVDMQDFVDQVSDEYFEKSRVATAWERGSAGGHEEPDKKAADLGDCREQMTASCERYPSADAPGHDATSLEDVSGRG